MTTKRKTTSKKPAAVTEPEPRAEKKVTPQSDGERYAARCAKIGSILHMADRLGVAPLTVVRRQTDVVPIAREAWLALSALEVDLLPEGTLA